MADRFFAQKHSPAGVRGRFAGLGAELAEGDRARLVEVLDGGGRPLLCLSPETALEQSLPLRIAATALWARPDRLLLHKRRESALGHVGVWDLYTDFVRLGEAREDAALRVLREDALGLPQEDAPGTESGLAGIRLLQKAEDLPMDKRFVSFFAATLPAGVSPPHPRQELLSVDLDELEGLVRDMPELLSPELVYAASLPGLLTFP